MTERRDSVPRSLRELGQLLGAAALCQAAGGLGAIATSDGVKTWYPGLRKPSFNPPSSLFAPVWTVLYAMMGGTLWLLRRNGADRETTLFAVQLALNTLWSFIFFRFRSPRWAFFEMIALLVAVVLTIVATWRITRLGALLMIPYLAWTSFALLLNGRIWRLNPDER